MLTMMLDALVDIAHVGDLDHVIRLDNIGNVELGIGVAARLEHLHLARAPRRIANATSALHRLPSARVLHVLRHQAALDPDERLERRVQTAACRRRRVIVDDIDVGAVLQCASR